MNFRIIFSFTTFAKQLIQDTERYHYLNYQKSKNKMFEQQYLAHKEQYFKTLINSQLDQVSNWKFLVENIFRTEQESGECLIQLVNKYKEYFGIQELSKIKNDKLSHIIINPDNIYQLQKLGDNIEELIKKYEDYELSLTVYRDVELNLLFRHLINCQKIGLQVFPVHTINLIHHNIEQIPDASFLNDLVKYLRSKRSLTYKLPNETWFLIFNKLEKIPLNEFDIQFVCQLIQQFAHQKIQIKFNIIRLIERIVELYKPATFKEYTLLEILRTVNILRANKYQVEEIPNLKKLCNNYQKLRGEKEYDIFMNLEHTASPNLQLIEEENFNTYLTEILLKDTKKLTEIEQTNLRSKIFNQLQTEVDQNSLKKIIVLSRQLWPNEISLIQKCAKQIRQKLQTNDQSKDMISLAINSLYEFKRVQYPFLDEQLLTYLASVEELYINPQEISVLLYYICQSQPKFTRKELYNIKKRDYKINQVISKILISILPVIQKMCQKNALRMKVLFTLTDCICKYKDELKNVDLKFLFEKIEFNLVNELEIKKQCRVSLEQKDIKFLKDRFFYLQVGSRKIIRFFDESEGNYFKALNYLLKRQRIYLRMRQKRGKAIRAQNSF